MKSRESMERRTAANASTEAAQRVGPGRTGEPEVRPASTGRRGHTRKKPGPGPLRRFFRTPKGSVLLVLLGLTVAGSIHASDRPGIKNILIAMMMAAAIDVVVGLIRKNKRVLPDGGMVTGLIIGLVLSGSVHWPVTALAAGLAVVSKHVLKIGRKPIFNPAALALLVTLLFFHTGQSWWGDLADLPVLFLPLLIVGGYFITSRVNKFPQVLTYLGTYFLLLTLAASLHLGNASFTPGDALRVPLVNAALFMAFFMLTDPPTSPGKYGEQVTFSVLAAVVSVAIYLVVGGLAYLLIGLLVANGWRALISWRSNRAIPRTGQNGQGSPSPQRDEYYV
jgi:Na+-translocating ferredoxin:NAD+ oxidoreductase RnfD subunit